MKILSPNIFVNYSHKDNKIVKELIFLLKNEGFKVFQDTTGINPGDNFVSKLSKEIEKSTAMVSIISDKYSLSRWTQAELYQALTSNKIVIPILMSNDSILNLDDPLQRLLRDKQYVVISSKESYKDIANKLTDLLNSVRKKYRKELFRKVFPYLTGLIFVLFSIWWIVENLNYLETANTRNDVVSEIKESKKIIQKNKVEILAKSIEEDKKAIGELVTIENDLAKSNLTRFNAKIIKNKLLNNQESYRWYINKMDIKNVEIDNISIIKTSFLGGNWEEVDFTNSVFANVFWGRDVNNITLSSVTFKNSQFLGSEIATTNTIDVIFENCKFLGSTINTTNFSKTKFITTSPETEGSPIITPYQTIFEKSLIINNSQKPDKNIIDLTLVGDIITFNSVMFIDCKFEGWFEPEWFRESNFINCELPASLNKEALENQGNIVIYDSNYHNK